MKTLFVLSALSALVLSAGCGKNLQSTRTFHLPPGDVVRGKAAFVSLKCIRCHTVDGVDLPPPTEPAEKTLALGGKVQRLRTYGDLLTSIVHPTDSMSDLLTFQQRKQLVKSPMPSVNDVMTVRDLVDLVAFLQSRYAPFHPLYEADFPSGP